jgi:hypothetical protein
MYRLNGSMNWKCVEVSHEVLEQRDRCAERLAEAPVGEAGPIRFKNRVGAVSCVGPLPFGVHEIAPSATATLSASASFTAGEWVVSLVMAGSSGGICIDGCHSGQTALRPPSAATVAPVM